MSSMGNDNELAFVEIWMGWKEAREAQVSGTAAVWPGFKKKAVPHCLTDLPWRARAHVPLHLFQPRFPLGLLWPLQCRNATMWHSRSSHRKPCSSQWEPDYSLVFLAPWNHNSINDQPFKENTKKNKHISSKKEIKLRHVRFQFKPIMGNFPLLFFFFFFLSFKRHCTRLWAHFLIRFGQISIFHPVFCHFYVTRIVPNAASFIYCIKGGKAVSLLQSVTRGWPQQWWFW